MTDQENQLRNKAVSLINKVTFPVQIYSDDLVFNVDDVVLVDVKLKRLCFKVDESVVVYDVEDDSVLDYVYWWKLIAYLLDDNTDTNNLWSPYSVLNTTISTD